MGIFTWTLANKPLRRLRSGDYAASCKLRYDGCGAVVCPDNTLLQEACYQGYGIFAGHDIYEDVVDWNKAHLTEIPQHPGFKHCFPLEENAACIVALNAFVRANYKNYKNMRLVAMLDELPNGYPIMIPANERR